MPSLLLCFLFALHPIDNLYLFFSIYLYFYFINVPTSWFVIYSFYLPSIFSCTFCHFRVFFFLPGPPLMLRLCSLLRLKFMNSPFSKFIFFLVSSLIFFSIQVPLRHIVFSLYSAMILCFLYFLFQHFVFWAQIVFVSSPLPFYHCPGVFCPLFSFTLIYIFRIYVIFYFINFSFTEFNSLFISSFLSACVSKALSRKFHCSPESATISCLLFHCILFYQLSSSQVRKEFDLTWEGESMTLLLPSLPRLASPFFKVNQVFTKSWRCLWNKSSVSYFTFDSVT